MKYINEEGLNKVIDAFGGKQLTVETQKEIHDFMQKENIFPDCIPGVNKKFVTVLAKMKLTARNPENNPNWCVTLSDGSQIVWNRRHQEFYRLESHGITNVPYHNWQSMFPEITWTDALDWLTDNMCDGYFNLLTTLLMKYQSGKFSELNTYFSF